MKKLPVFLSVLLLLGACSDPYFVDIIGNRTKLDFYQAEQVCGGYSWKRKVECMQALGWELHWK